MSNIDYSYARYRRCYSTYELEQAGVNKFALCQVVAKRVRDRIDFDCAYNDDHAAHYTISEAITEEFEKIKDQLGIQDE